MLSKRQSSLHCSRCCDPNRGMAKG